MGPGSHVTCRHVDAAMRYSTLAPVTSTRTEDDAPQNRMYESFDRRARRAYQHHVAENGSGEGRAKGALGGSFGDFKLRYNHAEIRARITLLLHGHADTYAARAALVLALRRSDALPPRIRASRLDTRPCL